MANLRSERTGLPFVVFISQKDGARHDVRVKVSASAKVRADEMGSYAARPCRHTDGRRLPPHEEKLLEAWIEKNIDVLTRYWDGEIEYTEDALGQIRTL
ncbi:hypothetical protein DK389_11235 [Methylobacterium durans]|uniref:DUF4160 domain-containing protein n=2 Tax=Methylobacterium durans TaxID=2202825 RepID=A0A2U8W6H2_9HYPH|nr:hypothetical protein DK389_11235 [Methylobacterium durans]